MRTPSFAEINAFIVLADLLNFSRAAAKLDISTSTLSGTIRTLEERLGIRLANRSTRSVALTEAGERLLASMRPVLNDYAAIVKSINAGRDEPAGHLRIVMWPSAANFAVATLVSRFMREFPEISLEISANPSRIDIVANHFDAGIDSKERLPRDMIAIRITDEIETAIVASPDYLARHPMPLAPQDLKSHNCLRYRLPDGSILPWSFQRDGQRIELAPSGFLTVNGGELMVQPAVDGICIAWLPVSYVAAQIADGRLVPILTDWTWKSDGFFLYFPGRRQISAPLQAFVGFLQKNYLASQIQQ